MFDSNLIQQIRKRVNREGFLRTLQAGSTKFALYPWRKIKARALESELRNRLDNKGVIAATGFGIQDLRARSLQYVLSMEEHDSFYGRYRYSNSASQTVLYNSLYAALLRHLYNDLEGLEVNQREEWISYIQSHQENDGAFRDTKIYRTDGESIDSFGSRHLTLHAIMALAALGAVATKELNFIKPFYEQGKIVSFLNSINWQDFVKVCEASNAIQNWGSFLQYARDFHGDTRAQNSLDCLFEWLDNNQNDRTGSWGKFFDTPVGRSYQMQTGYHIYTLYFYDKRPLNNVERIIDLALSTQNSLGGFAPRPNSTGCEDIDSIDPLVRLSFMTDYRREEVIDALSSALAWVFVNMNEDGGFVFLRGEAFRYGHELLFSKAEESAMFSAWFRTLSLAYLGQVFNTLPVGKYAWNFISCPGYQFWK